MKGIPEEWVECTLDDIILDIIGGGTPSKRNQSYYSGKVPFMTVKDMKSFRPKDTIDHITDEAISNSSTNLIPEGTIIVSTRMGLGKIVRVPFSTAINQDLKALIFSTQISLDFIEYYYRNLSPYLVSKGTGSTVKGITLNVLKSVPILLSSYSEQVEIASRLELLLKQVEKIESRIDSIPEILKRFRQSVLSAAVSGKLTEDWRGNRDFGSSVKLGKCAENIRYGTSKKCTAKAEGIPVLRIPNIKDGIIDHEDLKYASFDDKELMSFALNEGDILLIRSNGSIDLVGKPALISKNDEKCLFAGYLIRIRLNKSKVLPKYLLFCLQSPQVRNQIEITARSTSGVNNINSQELADLEFILPNIDEQMEIIKRVENYLSLSDSIDLKVRHTMSQINNLNQSILAKAFNGELTKEWRELNQELISGENSAYALLEKIHEAKKMIQTSNMKRKKGVKKVKMKEIIPITSALKNAGKLLTAQELLQEAGYPNDSNTETLENFFLDIREALESGNVKRTRIESEDVFELINKR